MEQNQLAGFELLFKIYEPTIKTKADMVILLTHYTLSIQCGMHCVCVDGEHCSKPTKYSEEQRSALLPVGWNKNNDTYKLYYYLNEELYKLTANSNSKGSLNIRLTNPSNGNSSALEISLEKLISRKQRGTTPVKVFIPKAENMVESLKGNLVKPVLSWRRRTIISTESNGYVMAIPSAPSLTAYTRNNGYVNLRNPSSILGSCYVGYSNTNPYVSVARSASFDEYRHLNQSKKSPSYLTKQRSFYDYLLR